MWTEERKLICRRFCWVVECTRERHFVGRKRSGGRSEGQRWLTQVPVMRGRIGTRKRRRSSARWKVELHLQMSILQQELSQLQLRRTCLHAVLAVPQRLNTTHSLPDLQRNHSTQAESSMGNTAKYLQPFLSIGKPVHRWQQLIRVYSCKRVPEPLGDAVRVCRKNDGTRTGNNSLRGLQSTRW